MNIALPYGHTHFTLDVTNLDAEIVHGDGETREMTFAEQKQIVDQAMEHPINAKALAHLSIGKKTATIIISDHTRPVPSKVMIPQMLLALREGSAKIDITLLVATGCHRAPTQEELVAKLGEEIVAKENIVIHDCDDQAALIQVGVLPSGAPLIVNRLAVETDLLLSEGFIEPHFFAGFSGGRKSVLPGVCARETVVGNHCASFIDAQEARSGILEHNPLHVDMVAAAEMVHLAYIVNVVLDHQKQVIYAVAGDPMLAHLQGCSFMAKKAYVCPAKKADIVVTTNGGYPLDQNIYQTVKGLATAEAVAQEGAVLILCAQCADGIGGDHFYQALREAENPTTLLAKIRLVPAPQTTPDQWQYQILARILEKHEVLFVTDMALCEIIENMHMTYCQSVEEAMDIALERKGKNAHVVVIPDGVSVYA